MKNDNVAWSLLSRMRYFEPADRAVTAAASFLFSKAGFIVDDTQDNFNGEYIQIQPTGNKFLDETYWDIYQLVKPFFDKIKSLGGEDIISLFFEELKMVNWDDFDAKAFDEMLLSIITSGGKSAGEFVQPKEVTELVCKLLDYKGGLVYNPFAGIASYGVTLGIGNNYVADEINQYAWVIGMSRLILSGSFSESYSKCDSFYPRLDPFDKCQYVVSTPPWNLKKTISYKEDYKTSDDYIWDEAMRILDVHGKCISVHAASVTYSRQLQQAREKLISKNYLDAVISLPQGVFYSTGINTVIVILRKDRAKDEPIKFFDATSDSFFTKERTRAILNVEALMKAFSEPGSSHNVVFVSPEEITHNENSLLPDTYFPSAIEEEEGINENTPRVAIKEVITYGGVYASIPETGHEIRTSDLTDDPFDFIKESTDILIRPLRQEMKYRKCTNPVLVISTKYSFKFAYIKASDEEPIFVPNGYLALEIDGARFDFRYFTYRLSRTIPALFRGAAMANLSISSFEKAVIACPPLEEQTNFYNDLLYQHKLAQAREFGLEELLESKKQEYKTLIRQRKHNMKTPLTEIYNTWKMLNLFINESPDMPSEEKLTKIKRYIKKQSVSIADLQKQMNRLTEENQFEDASSPLDINVFLKEREFVSDLYRITYEFDEQQFNQLELDPVTMVPESAVIELFNNIVDNAKTHGFDDFEKHGQYNIQIYLTAERSKDGSRLKIDFINDGRPLPKGMKKDVYGRDGSTAGDHPGSGRGGAYVKEMTEYYGGDYEVGRVVIDEAETPSTIITVYLPTPEKEDYGTDR